MSKRDFNDFQPNQLDRRLGAALLAAMAVVLVGLGVDATQGPALADVATAQATAQAPAPATVFATSTSAAPTLVAQAAQATATAGR